MAGAVSPDQLVLRDLDLDGDLDLVVASVAALEMSVWVNDGAGNFTLRTTTLVGAFDSPGFVVGKVDRDAYPDIINLRWTTATANNANINVVLNRGDATMGPVQLSPFAFDTVAPADFQLADFNQDGNSDLLVANTVHLGDGTVNFSNGAYEAFEGLSYAADLNADGWTDVASLSFSRRTLVSTFNDGTGSFTSVHQNLYYAGSAGLALDVNHDGRMDFFNTGGCGFTLGVPGNLLSVFQTLDGCVPSQYDHADQADMDRNGYTDVLATDTAGGMVTLFLGGPGTYLVQTANITFASPAQIVLADVTRDGNTDILVRNSATSVISLLASTGNITFASSLPLLAGAPGSFDVADIDDNGTLDVVAVATNAVTIKRLTGSGLPASGNSTPDASLSISAPTAIHVADVNRDGRSDLVVTTSTGFGVALGTGGGSFGAFTLTPAGTAFRDATVADFTDDGIPDILAAAASIGYLWQGRGDGTFTQVGAYWPNGSGALGVTHADYNNDGTDDAVMWRIGFGCCGIDDTVQLGFSR